jgi:molecular chaperone DnaK
MNKYLVGIDLGTSHCSMAYVQPSGKVEVLRDQDGDALVPSALFFQPNGTVLIGKAALTAGAAHPSRLLVETKRLMGEPNRRWRVDGASYTPVSVAALLLRHLRTDFEQRVGAIERAVVCVPAHYSVVQRRLTLDAAHQAGLHTVDLINEPIAAALAHILEGQDLSYLMLADRQVLLVYDLGGGSFDLSVVRYDNQRIKVLCADGKLKLGGIDWNRRLEHHLAQRAQAQYGVNLRQHKRLWINLQNWVERTKRRFSEPDQDSAVFGLRMGKKVAKFRVTRAEFEAMTQDLVEETRIITKRLLRNVGSDLQDLNQLLAVGGSTRLPMIQRVLGELCTFTPRALQPNFRITPDLAVVQGAALFARLWARPPAPAPAAAAAAPAAAPAPPAPPELTGVSARSLGVAVIRPGRGPLNRILVPKNAPLPASATMRVRPVRDGMDTLRIFIVEGDEEDLGACTFIGKCVINDLPTEVSANPTLDITVTVNQNNLLEVVVKHRETGKLHMVAIDWNEPSPLAAPGFRKARRRASAAAAT